VTIRQTDGMFTTRNCGNWVKGELGASRSQLTAERRA
jgi:hypothetical protein